MEQSVEKSAALLLESAFFFQKMSARVSAFFFGVVSASGSVFAILKSVLMLY